MMKEKQNTNNLRTIELSTNVNDYDTGEPILNDSIRETLCCEKRDNESKMKSNGSKIKLGSKYFN